MFYPLMSQTDTKSLRYYIQVTVLSLYIIIIEDCSMIEIVLQ